MSVKLDTARLQQLRQELRPRAAAVIAGAAFEVESATKRLAPVDTGALRNSIAAMQKGELLWWVEVGVEYGRFVEFGTSRMRAQPFLVPGVEQVRPRFEAQWAELFK